MSPKSARVSDVSRYEPMFLAYSEMLSTICAGGFKPKPRNKFAVWESDSLVDCSCRPQSVERSSTVFSINPRSAETSCVCMLLPYPAQKRQKTHRCSGSNRPSVEIVGEDDVQGGVTEIRYCDELLGRRASRHVTEQNVTDLRVDAEFDVFEARAPVIGLERFAIVDDDAIGSLEHGTFLRRIVDECDCRAACEPLRLDKLLAHLIRHGHDDVSSSHR